MTTEYTEAERAVASFLRDILGTTRLPIEERKKDVAKFLEIAIEQGFVQNTPLAINRVMALATGHVRE